MSRVVTLFILYTLAVWSYNPSQLYGEWSVQRVKNASGTINEESETVHFRPATVQIVMNTTVKKGNYLIKNLKIVADGIWKLNDNILVLVLQQVRVPEVEDVKGFSQKDINKLATNLRKKYLDDPIKIYKITNLDQSHIILLYEDGRLETFRRK